MQHIPIHIGPVLHGWEPSTAVKVTNSNGHFGGRAIMKCLSFVVTTLLCSHLGAQVPATSEARGAERHHGVPDESSNPVLQWNKALLVIVRTHGAQPATIHPTRSFAIMHAAIYDAVNAIDETHEPYLVPLT